jgi:hypothetical protein
MVIQNRSWADHVQLAFVNGHDRLREQASDIVRNRIICEFSNVSPSDRQHPPGSRGTSYLNIETWSGSRSRCSSIRFQDDVAFFSHSQHRS